MNISEEDIQVCNHKKLKRLLKEIKVGTGQIQKPCPECGEMLKIEITKQGTIIT